MKGKYRFIYLFALFVLEIACVYVPPKQQISSYKGEVFPDHNIVLTLDRPTYIVTSPRYNSKEDYPPNMDISYEIELKLPDEITQMSSRVLLRFEDFMLEESEDCKNDRLEINDLAGHILSYCGNRGNFTHLSASSQMQIRFFSNSKVESRGFKFTVNLYYTDCSRLFKGVSTGIFATPNFPHQFYPENNLCIWKIEAPEGKRILVKFNEIFDIYSENLLCPNDYLAVSLTGNFKKDYTRYCQQKRPETMISSNNSMLFMFRSACCESGKGFSAYFVITDSDGVVLPSPKMFCGCGQENKLEDERIIGGKAVDPPNRYPFVVALVKTGKQIFCGGTLISSLYVLTAATCIDRELFVNILIALGTHNTDSSLNTVPVSKFIIHPLYYREGYQADIALIRLRSPVQLTKTVRLACLPTHPQFAATNDSAIVSGWGATNIRHKYHSKELHELQVSIVSNELCYKKLFTFGSDKDICTYQLKDKGACEDDQGAPLFVQYEKQWFVIGVVSWKGSCGVQDKPNTYTRVSEYLTWISENIRDSPPCRDKEIIPAVVPNLENCGIPNEREEGRIAGGYIADPHEFPWIARIAVYYVFLGLGSLISPKYVLTTASTFRNRYDAVLRTHLINVFLGRHRISEVEPNFRRFEVEDVYLPKTFTAGTVYDNDIALLKLKVPATGMPDVYRPICLPRSKPWYSPGLKMKIAGWGRISKGGPVSDVLLKADMNVWSKELCVQRFPNLFNENMMCAYKDGTNTCKGDDGAPLMLFYYGRYYLAGLSSGGDKDNCTTYDNPGIFSAVHSNLKWIHNITGLIVD